jgi:dihydroflavonol-4-reductase
MVQSFDNVAKASSPFGSVGGTGSGSGHRWTWPVLTMPRWSLPPLACLVDLFNRVYPAPPLVTGQQIRLGGETFYVDNSKAVRELGLPQTSFRQAATDAYTWYREHGLL